MKNVERGDSVQVHYTGTLASGELFDTSDGGEPLGFTVGAGEVIPGFEQAVLGMQVGETKHVVIPPNEGYGEREASLVQTVQRDKFQLNGSEPKIGMALEMRTPDGHGIPLVITEMDDTTVTLDANHPLAGQTLHFALQLVGINA